MPSSLFSSVLLLLSTSTSILASPHPHAAHSDSHEHVERTNLPGRWWQDPNSDTVKLFKRDSSSSAAVGSTAWYAQYPAPTGTTVTTANIPQAWLDRLNAVTNSSAWVDYGPSALNGGYPLYTTNSGQSLQGTDPTVCSFTYGCVEAGDVYNATDGTIGLTFDDGPTDASPTLYTFLEQNNIVPTHFMIGGNIYWNWQTFLRAVQDGGHIAVHTWSHQYMTTLTNEQVLAELGWTMQIIYDSTGGKVPLFWRPPYGDVDNRVRLIAKEVFGLETVVWNHDSADWAIGSNPQYTFQTVEAAMLEWLTGPKTPGLIMLEHELNNNTVEVFMTMYPQMVSNGWKIIPVPDSVNMSWYQNQADNTSTLTPQSDFVQSAPVAALTSYSADAGDVKIASTTAQSSSTASSASSASPTGSSSGSTTSSSSGSTSSTSASSAAASTSSKSSGAVKFASSSAVGSISLVVGLLVAGSTLVLI